MSVSGKKRFEVLARDGFQCQYCGRDVSDGTRLEVDHVYPRSRGGSDDVKNLVTACTECNRAKYNSIIPEDTPEMLVNAAARAVGEWVAGLRFGEHRDFQASRIEAAIVVIQAVLELLEPNHTYWIIQTLAWGLNSGLHSGRRVR